MARSRLGLFVGCLVVFGLSCLVFWVNTRLVSDPPAWSTFEFCQYAEIGKNLAVDGTFDTRIVEPMALAAIDRDGVGPRSKRWPVVNRYPLPCGIIAGLMKAFGPTDVTAAWSNGLAISLLAATTYAAARIWFGAGWGAVVALLFLVNPSFYGAFILLGTPDVWFAAVFLLELLVWSQFDLLDPRFRPAWAVSVGILGGLAYLSRFNASVFLIIQGLTLLRHRRWRELAVVTVVALAVVSPMLAYNVHHFGRPFVSIYSAWNLLDKIGAYRVEPWLFYRNPDLLRELAAHGEGFARKFAANLFVVVPLGVWSLWRLEVMIPPALIGPWTGRRGTSFARFARWSVALFVVQLILFSAMRLEFDGRTSSHNGRYFFWFASPALLLAAGTFSRLSQGRRWVKALVTLAVLGQLGLFVAAWVPIVREQRRGSIGYGHDLLRQTLAEIVTEDQVIATDQPQITGWISGVRSISLPADWDELERINRESPTPIDYLFLDLNYIPIELDIRWLSLLQRDPRTPCPWEPRLNQTYEYVLKPELTRPLGYILLRRKGVPPSRFESEYNPRKT